MRNKYFDELVTENDLFYVCYMIEKTSWFLHQRNQYVVNQLGYDHLYLLFVLRMFYIVIIQIR